MQHLHCVAGANEVVPRVGSFPLRNFAQRRHVKGFEGQSFEIHPQGRKKKVRLSIFTVSYRESTHIRELYITFTELYAKHEIIYLFTFKLLIYRDTFASIMQFQSRFYVFIMEYNIAIINRN